MMVKKYENYDLEGLKERDDFRLCTPRWGFVGRFGRLGGVFFR